MVSFIPVTTPILAPPEAKKETLFDSLSMLEEEDVLLISAKVLAITQGRTKAKSSHHLSDLILQEAKKIWPAPPNALGFSLTQTHQALLPNAGIDASNSGDYWSLLPEEIDKTLKLWSDALKEKFNLSKLGLLAVDSQCVPFRKGLTGISLGSHGFEVLRDERGNVDLFGQKLEFTAVNVADSLAGMCSLMMGSANEATPLCIVRGLSVVFEEQASFSRLNLDEADDIFTPLLHGSAPFSKNQ